MYDTPVYESNAYLSLLPMMSYGGYSHPSLFYVPSGAASYYASSSNTNEVRVAPESECLTPAETCPVCENFVGLDVVEKFCSFQKVFSGTLKLDSRNETNACHTIMVEKNVYGNEQLELAPLKFSMKSSCPCSELTEDSSEVMVFLPQTDYVSNGKLTLDEEVHIVKKSESTYSDAVQLMNRCN